MRIELPNSNGPDARGVLLGLALLLAGLVSVGCGDDSDGDDAGMPDAGSDAPAVTDTEAPSVDIAFPPPRAIASNGHIMVRGRASDESDIIAIRVNNVMATSTNGFLDWQAMVPVAYGQNQIVVESEDLHGNRDTSAATVTVASPIAATRPADTVLSPTGDRMLVADAGEAALLLIHFETNTVTVLSSDEVGDGPSMTDISYIDVDWAGNRALVIEAFDEVLLSVDLTTGDREVVASSRVGEGPSMFGAVDLALDAEANRAYMIHYFDEIIFILSNAATGSGPDLRASVRLAVDPTGNAAFVSDIYAVNTPNPNAGVMAIDLANGRRTLLSDATVGTGPNPFNVYGLALDPTSERIIVGYNDDLEGESKLVAIDPLAGGNRVVITEKGLGNGPTLLAASSVALPDQGDYALVFDGELRAIFAVDLATGDRVIISR